jgi:hypothetical protein
MTGSAIPHHADKQHPVVALMVVASQRVRLRLGLGWVLLQLGLATLPAGAQTSLGAPDASNPHRSATEQRPADLVLLREWTTMEGDFAIGVHDAKADPRDPSARTIVVWVEAPGDVKLAVDTLRCSPAAPMRLTRKGRDLWIKELNPGGAITEANRLDHQIWWAACFPDQAGKDPATLQSKARQLGYSGQLREQQQVLPGTPR